MREAASTVGAPPAGGRSARVQLLAAILVPALLSLAVLGYAATRFAAALLRDEEVRQLESIQDRQRLAVEGFFAAVRGQVGLLASDTNAVRALQRLREATRQLDDDPLTADDAMRPRMIRLKDYLQRYYESELAKGELALGSLLLPQRSAVWLQAAYLATNPHADDEKDLLDSALDGSRYSEVHAAVHPGFRRVAETFHYADLLLVDAADGRIVYSVRKGLDFQTSLRDGPYAGSEAGRLFRSLRDTGQEGVVQLSDFAPYVPLRGGLAAFAGAPMFSSGKLVGVVLAELSVAPIDRLLSAGGGWVDLGLGATGDVFLVGPDKLMRSDSRQRSLVARAGGAPTAVLSQVVDSAGGTAASEGRTFTGSYVNHRGVRVLGVAAPLAGGGPAWSLVVEKSEAELSAPLAPLRLWVLWVVVALALVVTAWAAWVAWRGGGWLGRLSEAAAALRAGRLNARLPVLGSRELRFLAADTNAVFDHYVKLRRGDAEGRQQQEAELREMIDALTALRGGDFSRRARTDGALSPLAYALNAACAALREASTRLREVPARILESAIPLHAAAEQLARRAVRHEGELTRNAASLRDLEAAIGDASSRVGRVAAGAVRTGEVAAAHGEAMQRLTDGVDLLQKYTRSAAGKMKRLGERSMEVSALVGPVGRIASAANVLALNAAIEAARGEPGGGAPLVADELRRLAERSETAREDISRAIAALQAEANEAVAGMDRHRDHVEQHAEAILAIARLAGDVQRVLAEAASGVSDVCRTVSEQAAGTGAIMAAADGAVDEAHQTRVAAEHAREQVARLISLAGDLGEQVRALSLSEVDGVSGPNGNMPRGVASGGAGRS